MVVIVGSQALSFIKNKHDIDLVAFGDFSNEKIKKTLNKVCDFNYNSKIDLFKKNYVDWKKAVSQESLSFLVFYDSNLNLYLKDSTNNILKNRKLILKRLKEEYQYIISNIDYDVEIDYKFLYRYEILIYILENNTYDLTEEEIIFINNLHDKKLLEEQILEYKNNLILRIKKLF